MALFKKRTIIQKVAQGEILYVGWDNTKAEYYVTPNVSEAAWFGWAWLFNKNDVLTGVNTKFKGGFTYAKIGGKL
jgi:hypothetical protein